MSKGDEKIVVYTAIFGKKDVLHDPLVRPIGVDFVCFTDQPLSSSVWRVVRVSPPEKDSTRSARKYKILAHKFLPEYDMSMWVDGNVLVKGDVREFLEKYLSVNNFAVFDHAQCPDMPISTLAEHEERLLAMERAGKHQEDPDLMHRQGEAYRADGYPDDRGLAWTLVLLRRHNAPDVVRAMDAWWQELVRWSKRDQISFNYVAWKTGLLFSYIPLDGMDNPYTKRLNHYLRPIQKLRSYIIGGWKRCKRIFGVR